MEDKTIIEITNIDKKQQPSKFNAGEFYTIVTVSDGRTGRKGTAFGPWAEGWKLGDTVEAIWSDPKEWQGETVWKLNNPNAKPRPTNVQPTYGSTVPSNPASHVSVEPERLKKIEETLERIETLLRKKTSDEYDITL